MSWVKPDLDQFRTTLYQVERERDAAQSGRSGVPKSSDVTSGSVFIAKTSSHSHKKFNKPKGSIKKDNHNCFYCGKSGHIRPNCPAKIEDLQRGIKLSSFTGVPGPNGKVSKSGAHIAANTMSSSFVSQEPPVPPPSNMTNIPPNQSIDEFDGFCFVFDDDVSKLSPARWILDSGASQHICNDLSLLNNPVPGTHKIAVGQSACISSFVMFDPLEPDKGDQSIRLSNVWFCDEAAENIISISVLTDQGCHVVFEGQSITVYARRSSDLSDPGRRVLHGTKSGSGLYVLDSHFVTPNKPSLFIYVHEVDKTELWHRRLGHLSYYRYDKSRARHRSALESQE